MIPGYKKLLHRTFSRFDLERFASLEKLLYESDSKLTLQMFFGAILMFSLLSLPISLLISYALFRIIFPSEIWTLLLLLISSSAFLISMLAMPMIILNRISSKKVDIEKRLPLVMAYMAMLASSGMNPVNIIKNVAIKDFGAVSREFGKIVYRIEIVGEDLISAINHLANRTPSKNLSDILIGMANIIISGGDLRTYCEQKSKELFEERRIKLREFIDSLASFSEGYMGGVLISIVMGVLGIIVIGALGIKIAFFTTSNLLDLLVYFIVPFINILFLALLEFKYSKVVV